jgi:hypothetical protein
MKKNKTINLKSVSKKTIQTTNKQFIPKKSNHKDIEAV